MCTCCLALKVIPSHSYAFLTPDDDEDLDKRQAAESAEGSEKKVILGNPNLNVHGDVAYDSDGIKLNGLQTQWLD